ncbi:MAG: hypothetical protein OEQ49_01915 [Myxococcales bacterium]|nr:hypothetical protein [Myxococcales bacterium]
MRSPYPEATLTPQLVGFLLMILAASCTTCERESQGPRDEPNLLRNPGFEEGRERWSADEKSPLWGEFQVAESPTRSGSRSVHFAVDSSADATPRPSKVFGVFQDLTVHPFPERVTGYYRVEDWQNETEGGALYLQVVVVVFGGPPTQGIIGTAKSSLSRQSNYQIRYYLAGAPEVAVTISNAKIEIRSGDPPPLKEWVRFDLPVRRDFERLWGAVPEDYEKVRFLFEARWDKKRDRGSVVKSNVYYDDLSVVPHVAATD